MLSSELIVFVPTSLSTAITARASLERFILYVQFGVNLSRQHNYSFLQFLFIYMKLEEK